MFGSHNLYSYMLVLIRDIKPTYNCASAPSWLQFTIPCPRPDDNEEEVYDDLCYVTFSTCLPEVGIV